MIYRCLKASLLLACCLPLTSAEEAPQPKEPTALPTDRYPQAQTREDSVLIAGETISYSVTADTLTLRDDQGEERAAIFHVSYLRQVPDASNRPVLFAFNGGPGSSAVWLHLGALGPKIVPTSKDGTQALSPPIILKDNPASILDVADLVFIDPVSTGYSRTENETKPKEFHGLEADIESVADFIRIWTTKNKRWASPKFLLGESYGGIRATGLASHLQSRYGMSLNGVVLLSSLLDFRTLLSAPGSDLDNLIFLPAFVATAHHHGKVEGDLTTLLEQAEKLVSGSYAQALWEGAALTTERKNKVAAQLSRLTGIETELWLEHHLRLSPSRFRRELLRSEGKVLGRFDSRVAWPAQSLARDFPSYDPSYAVIYGAFSTAMLDYLSRELEYTPHFPYEILSNKVRPWDWDADNEYVNVAPRLQTALRDNPSLRVLVMGGLTDLATPPAGMRHSLNHLLNLPEEARQRISETTYAAGHMFYLNEPDLKKMRTDLVEFINN